MSSSRIESFELRSSHDKHHDVPQEPPPAYYPAEPHGISHPSADYPAESRGISRSSLFFGLYLVLPALATASVIALGFKSTVAPIKPSAGLLGQWLEDEDVLMAQWPSSLFPNQLEITVAVAVVALATSVLISILLLFVIRGGPLQTSYPMRLGILVYLGLNAAFALAGTIYTFVLNATSAIFDFSYAVSIAPKSPGTFTYDQGTFNLESWACSVRGLPNFDADMYGDMAKTCNLEIGTRWLMLFTFIFSIGLFSLLYLDSRGGRHFMRP